MSDPIMELATDAQATADRLAALPTVVGVSVATVVAGRVGTGAAGLADAETGAPATVDLRWRPGSVTKLLTAALAHRHLPLDEPVATWVPGFDGVAVRHLVSHTSGVDAGDVFVDTGDDDGALARYVALVAGAPRLFPPGSAFSYNNAGFVLAGHLLQEVTGRTWESLVADLVPTARFVTGTAAGDDLDLARAHAAGFGEPAPLPRRLDDAMATRALGPAGGTLSCTAAGLAAFVADHLATPRTGVMRELQAEAPGGVPTMRGPGMGWMVWRNAVQDSVRIGGAYPGHSAVIAADPATGTAVVVMTNTELGINAVTAVLDAAGPVPADPAPVGALERYAGDYESHVARVSVEAGEGVLRIRLGEHVADATPVDGVTFATPAGPVAFFGDDGTGRARHLRWRMRVATRCG